MENYIKLMTPSKVRFLMKIKTYYKPIRDIIEDMKPMHISTSVYYDLINSELIEKELVRNKSNTGSGKTTFYGFRKKYVSCVRLTEKGVQVKEQIQKLYKLVGITK